MGILLELLDDSVINKFNTGGFCFTSFAVEVFFWCLYPANIVVAMGNEMHSKMNALIFPLVLIKVYFLWRTISFLPFLLHVFHSFAPIFDMLLFLSVVFELPNDIFRINSQIRLSVWVLQILFSTQRADDKSY